jgi:uncharacterized membrane protein
MRIFTANRGRDNAAYARAAAIGAVAGLRALLPFGLLAAALARRRRLGRWLGFWRRQPVPRALGSRQALIGWGLAAAGELVADKLPFMPARVRPPFLAGRLAAGALSGAATGAFGGRSPWLSAGLGAGAAGAAATVGYLGRTTLSRLTPLPQQAWGALEDGLALALGARALGLGRR